MSLLDYCTCTTECNTYDLFLLKFYFFKAQLIGFRLRGHFKKILPRIVFQVIDRQSRCGSLLGEVREKSTPGLTKLYFSLPMACINSCIMVPTKSHPSPRERACGPLEWYRIPTILEHLMGQSTVVLGKSACLFQWRAEVHFCLSFFG